MTTQDFQAGGAPQTVTLKACCLHRLIADSVCRAYEVGQKNPIGASFPCK